ncbi:MAG: hypothetical protein RPS99_08890 [Gammaproteobacteria bacterium]
MKRSRTNLIAISVILLIYYAIEAQVIDVSMIEINVEANNPSTYIIFLWVYWFKILLSLHYLFITVMLPMQKNGVPLSKILAFLNSVLRHGNNNDLSPMEFEENYFVKVQGV